MKIVTEDYYTDTWSVLQALKHNIREYALSSVSCDILRYKKWSWNVGFIFDKTLMPAITVFPLQKVFHPRMSGGVQHVEYRSSIDVYTSSTSRQESKSMALRAVDDITTALKSRMNLVGRDSLKHSFRTTINAINYYEDDSSQAAKSFVFKASVEVSSWSLHTMDEDRIRDLTPQESNPDQFYDSLFDLLVVHARSAGVQSRLPVHWVNKTVMKTPRYPMITVLPGAQYLDENLSSQYATVIRPTTFILSVSGYPTKEVIQSSLLMMDTLVGVVERCYKVDGLAWDCEISHIDYMRHIEGMVFETYLSCEYKTRQQYDPVRTGVQL